MLVDASATNLEAALRLADAVLPSDARRRVVLVSDGRATIGDTIAEAEELAGRGTQIDVHLIESAGGTDAALGELDAPSLARIGESVEITATVEANDGGPAVVVLRRDGVELAREQLELIAGPNQVSFTDQPTAEAGAVLRYQVTVEQGGDVRQENDAASSRFRSTARRGCWSSRAPPARATPSSTR